MEGEEKDGMDGWKSMDWEWIGRDRMRRMD